MSDMAVRESVLGLELGWRALNHLEAENCELGESQLTDRTRSAAIGLRISRPESVCLPAA